MKAASINEIKKELAFLETSDLLIICLRLAKFKKENKELLDYLLFDSKDEEGYIKKIKAEIALQFTEINRSNLYWAKKSIRKILKNTNKYIKYSGKKETEIELLLFFCKALKDSGIAYKSSTPLKNLYDGQLKKIGKTILTLHDDLQYDFKKELDKVL